MEKNQNQKCIPYDYNRVVLEKINGIPDSDYYNASYVDVSGPFLSYSAPTLTCYPPAEPPQAECVHRDAGPDGGDGHRLLATRVAGGCQCNHHADEDVRLYQSDVRAVLAGQQGEGRGVRGPLDWHRGRGTVGQLPDPHVPFVHKGLERADPGGAQHPPVPLLRMALAFGALSERGPRVQATCSSGSGQHNYVAQHHRAHAGPLQVSEAEQEVVWWT